MGVKRKTKTKFKFRMFFFVLFFVFSVSILSCNCVNNILKLLELQSQKKELQKKIVFLTDEKENLEADVQRLSDSTYIARYAREKYLYSKDDEIIIRIEDE